MNGTHPDQDTRDLAALKRLGKGETHALGDLAVQYEPALLGLARGLLGGSRGLAEEAVQDVWIRVLGAAGSDSASFRGEAGVKTWLYRITINRCRDIKKREARRGRREMVSFRLVRDTDEKTTWPPDEEPGDRAEVLHKALAALPTTQREAVLLCHHRGMTHATAAQVLAIPEGTLKGRVRSGLAALRKRLGEEPGQTETGYSDAS